jgi:hypothetical protein
VACCSFSGHNIASVREKRVPNVRRTGSVGLGRCDREGNVGEGESERLGVLLDGEYASRVRLRFWGERCIGSAKFEAAARGVVRVVGHRRFGIDGGGTGEIDEGVDSA